MTRHQVFQWLVRRFPKGIIDSDGLVRRFDGRRDFVAKLFRSSLDYYANTPNELRALLAEGNLEEIKRIAHGLKGTGGNLMAPRLRELAQKVQGTSGEAFPETREQVTELLLVLEVALKECQFWLDSYNAEANSA